MLKNKRILITCGPTWVPVDGMRVISNRSSGQLGQQLAQDFAKAGAKVTLLEGPVKRPLDSKSVKILKFSFFDELSALLKTELNKKYRVCIHAAAVSDYKLKSPKKVKLSSRMKSLKLELVPTEKLVYSIKKHHPGLFLVAFKLESKMTKSEASVKSRALFEKGQSDLVVANSLQGKNYNGYVLDRKRTVLAHERSREKLSKTLLKIVKGKLK